MGKRSASTWAPSPRSPDAHAAALLPLRHPGVFASADTVKEAQRTARRCARAHIGHSELERLELIDNERELRPHRLMRRGARLSVAGPDWHDALRQAKARRELA